MTRTIQILVHLVSVEEELSALKAKVSDGLCLETKSLWLNIDTQFHRLQLARLTKSQRSKSSRHCSRRRTVTLVSINI